MNKILATALDRLKDDYLREAYNASSFIESPYTSPEKLAEANREALYWRAKINTISEVWKKYQEIEKEMKDNETCNS